MMLSEESLARLEQATRCASSTARIPRDRPIADSRAAESTAHLTSEAGAFFEAVTKGLARRGGEARLATPRLVRGLDYYRHTAFEFTTDRLGAQGTVLGGGRYDGLIGGARRPAYTGGRLGGGYRAAGECLWRRCRRSRAPIIAVVRRPSGSCMQSMRWVAADLLYGKPGLSVAGSAYRRECPSDKRFEVARNSRAIRGSALCQTCQVQRAVR